MRELPVAFIAYDLIECDGRDLRAEPQHVRRALLEALVERLFAEAKARGERLPIRISPTVSADTWEALAEKREQARALGARGADAEGARGRLWDRPAQGRRPHRCVVEVEARPDERRRRADLRRARPRAPLRRLQRLHLRRLERGRRSAETRELVPFAKAYSGLSDAEMREMDAIIRRTTVETFGPVRSVTPTQVFELGFEGIAPSKRHKSGVAVRFPRMLRWRRDKPVAEADTLDALKALLAGRTD